jgi:hypothetical protein
MTMSNNKVIHLDPWKCIFWAIGGLKVVLVMLIFAQISNLKGRQALISTTAGGGLGVKFQDMTLGFHLEPFATI